MIFYFVIITVLTGYDFRGRLHGTKTAFLKQKKRVEICLRFCTNLVGYFFSLFYSRLKNIECKTTAKRFFLFSNNVRLRSCVTIWVDYEAPDFV